MDAVRHRIQEEGAISLAYNPRSWIGGSQDMLMSRRALRSEW
jgi:hypothetical protein